MRKRNLHASGILTLALLASSVPALRSFPPAPDHTVLGMVRDEMGRPLPPNNTQVLLETTSGVQVKGEIVNGLEPGANYRLSIPMDAGITADPYKPTALKPSVPFKMWVRINGVRYLPIQMKGDYSHLGEPSKRTQIDLTLGEDADGDGLPDAWERALNSMTGGKRTLADINANGDDDGDGLSNLQEYLAGTYAFDPKDGFSLAIVGNTVDNNPVLEFLAIAGHSYSVLASNDLNDWRPVPFRPVGSNGQPTAGYYATDTRNLQVEAVSPEGRAAFYKLMVN